uniref:Astrotactin-1/2 Fn3 domain-containing protein n=1 Tax=Knipowitschia caucasica TaxID=637954 RepID=A0AAV2IUN7_KNICA
MNSLYQDGLFIYRSHLCPPCAAGEVLSLVEDLLSGLGSGCVAVGRRPGERPHTLLYSVIFKCLEPDSLYNGSAACLTCFHPDHKHRRTELQHGAVRNNRT